LNRSENRIHQPQADEFANFQNQLPLRLSAVKTSGRSPAIFLLCAATGALRHPGNDRPGAAHQLCASVFQCSEVSQQAYQQPHGRFDREAVGPHKEYEPLLAVDQFRRLSEPALDLLDIR
jgi:hypothetical protein